jgi:hypothetical protein
MFIFHNPFFFFSQRVTSHHSRINTPVCSLFALAPSSHFEVQPYLCMYSNQLASTHNPHRGFKHTAAPSLPSY